MFPRLAQPARLLRSSPLIVSSIRHKSDETLLGSMREAITQFGKQIGWGYDASGRDLRPGKEQLPWIYENPEDLPIGWKRPPADETLAPSPEDSPEMQAKKVAAIEQVQATTSRTSYHMNKGTIPTDGVGSAR